MLVRSNMTSPIKTNEANATMAVFLDLENIALGAHDAHYPPVSIQKVLERLLLKGQIVVKKAYCDFDRYKSFKRDLHESAFELIEIPRWRSNSIQSEVEARWCLRAVTEPASWTAPP